MFAQHNKVFRLQTESLEFFFFIVLVGTENLFFAITVALMQNHLYYVYFSRPIPTLVLFREREIKKAPSNIFCPVTYPKVKVSLQNF